MAREARPAMLFYGKDWYDDIHVQEMSYEEQGMYLRLCWLCWTEGSIPDDQERIARILKVDGNCQRFANSWALLRQCFTLGNEGTLAHGKVEEIRRDVEAISKTRQEAGKRGAIARWRDGKPDSKAVASGVASTWPSSSSSSAIEVQQQSASPDGVRVAESFSLEAKGEPRPDPRDAWFEEFWSRYSRWRNRDKKRAKAVFARLVKTEETFRAVLAGIERQDAEMLARSPEHRPHCSTWLAGERWKDEGDESPRVGGDGTVDDRILSKLEEAK